MTKEQFFPEIFADVRRKWHLVRWLAKDFRPKLISAVGEEQPADAATHTMSDNHHRFHFGKALFNSVEFFTQDRRGIGIWIPARVTIKPELVVFPADPVAAQLVDHRSPGRL